MRPYKILVIVPVIVAAAVLASSGQDDPRLAKVLHIDGIFHDRGEIEIIYKDTSGGTESVTLEVLGMRESFQRTYSGSEFTETIEFPRPPSFGWEVHPITLIIQHNEFGTVHAKTEIRSVGEPVPRIIFSVQ